MSQGEYLSMVSEFDVGLISLDARLTSHNIPGKLLSYLYWGVPVLEASIQGMICLRCCRKALVAFVLRMATMRNWRSRRCVWRTTPCYELRWDGTRGAC